MLFKISKSDRILTNDSRYNEFGVLSYRVVSDFTFICTDAGIRSALIDHCEGHGVIEFPRQRLQFVDKLGEGQFGEVQLCKADPSLRCYAEQNG